MKKFWQFLDGNKTYITAGVMVALSVINRIFPEAMPEPFYEEIRGTLEFVLYGTVGHKVYKVINNQKK